jgi:hypothetical protein
MIRQPVQSSNIKSVGYDSQNKTLEVEFKSGGIFQYHNVNEDAHKNLLNADSIGSHFHKNIKSNYGSTKIK